MKILRRLFLAVIFVITLPINVILVLLAIVATFILSFIGWILTGDENSLVDPELPLKVCEYLSRVSNKINSDKNE